MFLTEEGDGGTRWVPGVVGYAPMADVMHLVGQVDDLRDRLEEITTSLQGAGAMLSLRPVVGAN